MSANDELQAHTCEKIMQEHGNVANEKVQDLTEAWKNGELEVGEYYLRYKDGTIDREYYDYVRLYEMVTLKGFSTEDCEISEVLAPVPSYIQWNAMLESNDSLVQTINALKNRLVEVAEENAKLKELLKECRKALNKAKGDTVWYPVEIDHVVSKIDEVLK